MPKFAAALLWFVKVILLLCAVWLITLLVSALVVDANTLCEKNSPYYRFLLNSGTAVAVWLLGIKVHINGADKLPENDRFLLVGNHRSKFDPILTWYAFNTHIMAFISKPENFNIPIFGRIIRKCCFMPIDRENPRNALGTIEHAAKLIEKNEAAVAVYPEGTRSKSGVLLPFHNGVFKIAQKADVPIVVAAISGTENIHKNVFRRRSDVYITIAEVIPAEYVRENRTSAIGERVKTALSNTLDNTMIVIEGDANEKLYHTV